MPHFSLGVLQKLELLVLLDLSAAFDTVDHNILLDRLENWVGLSGIVLKWFRSYLGGRGYYVSIGDHKSEWTSMTCGVPQGSILAPLLFDLYMLPMSQIMRKNQIAYHSYRWRTTRMRLLPPPFPRWQNWDVYLLPFTAEWRCNHRL